MGEPGWDWRLVPLAEPCDPLAVPLDVPGPAAPGRGPDAGIRTPCSSSRDLAGLDVGGLGGRLVRHPMFPEGANIGFAQLLEPGVLRLRVFERGAGLTQACGSGACAAMAAARRAGLVGGPRRG